VLVLQFDKQVWQAYRPNFQCISPRGKTSSLGLFNYKFSTAHVVRTGELRNAYILVGSLTGRDQLGDLDIDRIIRISLKMGLREYHECSWLRTSFDGAVPCEPSSPIKGYAYNLIIRPWSVLIQSTPRHHIFILLNLYPIFVGGCCKWSLRIALLKIYIHFPSSTSVILEPHISFHMIIIS
jgi:hypothetical protein